MLEVAGSNPVALINFSFYSLTIRSSVCLWLLLQLIHNLNIFSVGHHSEAPPQVRGEVAASVVVAEGWDSRGEDSGTVTITVSLPRFRRGYLHKNSLLVFTHLSVNSSYIFACFKLVLRVQMCCESQAVIVTGINYLKYILISF